jgi:hypothetical protein
VVSATGWEGRDEALLLGQGSADRARQRRVFLASTGAAVGVVLLALGVAGAVIVARYLAPPGVAFEAPPKKVLKIPPQVREVRLAQAEFEAAAPLPAFPMPALSSRVMDSGLPPLPAMPMDASLPSLPGTILGAAAGSAAAAGSSGAGGLGSGGLGAGSGLGGLASGVGFFGIQDRGESVVLMIDVSGSMFLRLGDAAFETVRDEAAQLVDALAPGTRFGIVVWSGGAGRWREQLVPASAENREAARAFIAGLDGHAYRRLGRMCAQVLRDEAGGTRHDLALRQAFTLKPEVVYLISDGNAMRGTDAMANEEIWSLARGLQKELETPARLHAIYFVTGPAKANERELLQKLARSNGGKFREVSAAAPDAAK